MKKVLPWVVGSAAVFGCAVLTVYAGSAGAQDDREDIMQWKLREAQGILRALTEEDFPTISESARQLRQLSIEAEWTDASSPVYGRMGNEFRLATDRLERAAMEENLDSATLNYNQLVTSCVECHKVVRGESNLAAAGLPERDWH